MMEEHPCIAGLWNSGSGACLARVFGYNAYVSRMRSDCDDLPACTNFCSGCEEVCALEQGLSGPARLISTSAPACVQRARP